MLYLVTNEKGGVGKSTLAVNLAVMSALAGRETLLVDTDHSRNASTWATVRRDEGVTPVIVCVEKTGKVGQDLVSLKEKYETVIVDSGGRDSIEMRQALVVCDFALVPMRPAQFDLWSTAQMAQLVRDAEERRGSPVNAHAVINAANTNPAVKEEAETREALQDFADVFPILETTLFERIAYRKAVREGRGIAELVGTGLADPKGVAELAALFQEIMP